MCKKVFCCCSGGIDSVVAVAKLESEGYQPIPVYVKYGQKTASKEVESLFKCYPGTARTLEIDLSRCIKGWATNPNENFVPVLGTDPELLFIPGRNIFILLRMCVEAYYEDVHFLALGNHKTDRVCGDCKPPFLDSFQKSLSLGMSTRERDYNVSILQPIAHMTKTDVVRWGIEHNVPLSDTWSCYDVKAAHCGVCHNCMDRKIAFKNAGAVDPTEYYG